MNTNEVLGIVVTALITLGTLYQMVTKPLKEQNAQRETQMKEQSLQREKQIETNTKLVDAINNLEKFMQDQERNNTNTHKRIFAAIENHDNQIMTINESLVRHDKDIEFLKRQQQESS